jgi:hypothetical protein
MGQQSATSDLFADFVDRYRCRERDGVGARCQLVVGHDGQHLLQRDGRPVGVAGRCSTTYPDPRTISSP